MAENYISSEIWKTIPFADGYSVSSEGRFRADRQTSSNWKAGPRKPLVNRLGYSYVRFLSGGKMRRMQLSRLVATVFHGDPPTETHQCAHCDGNPRNNRADNLRWATPAENNYDKRRHGTYHLGEKTTTAKLTDDDVRFIRLSQKSGAELAAKFGVTRRTIDRARNGDGWPHIDVPPVKRRRGVYNHPNQGCRVSVDYQGATYTMPQLARLLGITRSALRNRIHSGWPEERWGEATR